MLVLLNAGLVAFFWANVVTGVVLVAVTLALMQGNGAAAAAPSTPSRGSGSCARRCRYALAAAVGLIYFRIAVVLMSYVSTDEETGIFSAAFRIVEVVGVLPWMLVSAGFPILARAARDDEERLRYALQKIFEVATVLGVFIALGLAVAAPFAIEVVAGTGFEASVPVLRLQAVGLVTSFLMVTWTYALLSLRLYRPLLLANAAGGGGGRRGDARCWRRRSGAEGAAMATVRPRRRWRRRAVGCAARVTVAALVPISRSCRRWSSPRRRAGGRGLLVPAPVAGAVPRWRRRLRGAGVLLRRGPAGGDRRAAAARVGCTPCPAPGSCCSAATTPTSGTCGRWSAWRASTTLECS